MTMDLQTVFTIALAVLGGAIVLAIVLCAVRLVMRHRARMHRSRRDTLTRRLQAVHVEAADGKAVAATPPAAATSPTRRPRDSRSVTRRAGPRDRERLRQTTSCRTANRRRSCLGRPPCQPPKPRLLPAVPAEGVFPKWCLVHQT